jgi:DNA-binding CsgD family transcriptional regulator
MARALAGLDPAAASAAAAELTRAGLIDDRQPLELAHPIVRASVLSGLTLPERSSGHARAAGLLRAGGAGAEVIAKHLLFTDPGSDPRVVDTLKQAARSAMGRGAPEAAVRLLRRALQERPAEHEAVELLLDLGHAEQEANVDVAADRFREAYRRGDTPVRRAEALRGLVWAITPDHREHSEIQDDLDRAIAEVSPLDRELGLALEAARLGGLMLSPGKRAEMAERLRAVDELAGATPGECVLLAMLARYRMDAGRPWQDVAIAAERAAANPRTLEVEGAGSLWLLNCAVALVQCERFEPLELLLARALDLARERGLAAAFALVSTHRSRLARKRGALRDAEAEAHASLATGALYSWYRSAAASQLITTLTEQGKLDEAQAACEATGIGEQVPDHRPMTPFLISRGILRRAQGDLERAAADLREGLHRIGRYATATAAGMDARLALATSLYHLGRPDAALSEADQALPIARAWGTPGMLGEAIRARALILQGETRISDLQEAVALLAASPLRLEHAHSLVDLGAALRRAGRRADCRQPLSTGLELAERCGAEPLARLARQELGASGARISRHRAGDELTPSERRIVDMAAEGMSNPQIAQALFVTIKTVESHLSHAYLKLGVKSRHQLGKALKTARAEPGP